MYSWQVDYIAALLEKDESRIRHHVDKAIAAIEQRLLSPIDPGSVEYQALKQAQKVLKELQTEKVKPIKAPKPRRKS